MRALSVALAVTLLAGCQSAMAPPVEAPPSDRAGELVVGFKTETSEAERAAIRAQFSPDRRIALTTDSEWWSVPGGDGATLQAALATTPGVRYTQPNTIRRLNLAPPYTKAAAPALRFSLAQAANDPLFSRQWHLTRCKFPQAWEKSTGKGVTVAVIDSGVDPKHPDLAAKLMPLVDEVVAFGRHDKLGKELFDGRDGNGHGTHVCGIVGAIRNNGLGVVGGAPDCTILPIKVTANDGETDDATIAKGIRDGIAGGARVLNLSIGGPEPSPLLLEALDEAFAKNIAVCIASGNDGGKVNYPAAYAGVIAVGGFTELNQVAGYSSRGDDLVLVAPGGGQSHGREGDQITSCFPTYDCWLTTIGGKPKDYGGQAGTSMASPLVSALAALVIAQNPNLSGPQVRTRIAAACEDLGTPGWDSDSGWGVIDAEKALSF